jgi:hypothetical protein
METIFFRNTYFNQGDITMLDENGNFNERKTGGFVFRWWMFFLLLFVIGAIVSFVVWAIFYPMQLRVERTANRESQQMVQSVTESLRKDMVSWVGLNNQITQYQAAMTDPKYADSTKAIQSTIDGLHAQQNALVRKMHTDADSLTPSGYAELPADIQSFLQAHP